MNPSREYIRNLPIERRRQIAKGLGITEDFIYQIGIGIRNPSRKLALKLEKLTNQKVKESDFDNELREKISD